MPRLVCLLLSLASLLPGLASARVLDQGPNGFTLQNEVVVPVTAERAYRALTEEVGQWWPDDHTWWGGSERLSIEARAGGCFCERQGEAQARHMEVVFVDPPRLLRMVGGLGPLQGMGWSGALEWRFAAVEGGTRITLWYRAGGYAPEDLGRFVAIVDQVQGLQLGGLARHLGAAP
ncbi:MAG TPA: SRPBCC family protein [Nevskiaceae bacterium]|nr:SRPBCC family protein [Nevskiaceae bacterium]